MKKDFKGKTVVITGASAGLGRAMVREFVKHGANIGLIARGEMMLFPGAAVRIRQHGAREFIY